MPTVLLVVLAVACDGQPDVVPDGPWPVTVPDVGVLGYYALPGGTSDELAEVCEALLGYRLRGLGGATPVALVSLDPKVLGGSVAVIAPVENAELLTASLELWPGLQALGDDRYRLALPPDAGLTILVRSLGLATVGSTPGGMLSALGSMGAPTFNLNLVIEGDRVFAAPTFEALGACRKILRSVPGLSTEAGELAVASLDARRFRAAYATEIAQFKAQARSAFATASMVAGREGVELPVDAGIVDSLYELSGFERLEWLHLTTGIAGLRAAFFGWEGDAPEMGFDLSLAFEDTSPHAAMIGMLRPSPVVEGADVVMSWSSDPAGADMVVAWLEPLTRELGGAWAGGLVDGLPSVDEMRRGVLGNQVTVALFLTEHPQPVIVFDPARKVDWDDVLKTVGEAIVAAGTQIDPGLAPPDLSTRIRDDGAVELLADGDVTLTVGQIDDIAWLVGGPIDVPPGDLCLRLAQAEMPAEGPSLRVHPGDESALAVGVIGDGNVLRVHADVQH